LVTIIATIPCHNDAYFLEKAVTTLKNSLETIAKDYKILIVEDGSADNSADLSKELAKRFEEVIHIHHDEKQGRGKALMNAWREINGEIYTYIDCDLATDMSYYPELIKNIQSGYDLATGSRYMKGSICHRPFLRKTSSLLYNGMIRVLFSENVRDHQCGFKAFSNQLVDYMLENCKSEGWFWDTEAIVLAYRKGFKIIEFPVKWKEMKGERTPLKRLIKDIWIHGTGIIGLFYRTVIK
jgi:glycosyltransferase involved in cell wall biosynthesis